MDYGIAKKQYKLCSSSQLSDLNYTKEHQTLLSSRPIPESNMLSILRTAALFGPLTALAAATPTNTGSSKRSPLGISLPPLIPAIPGVTEPLASNAPPLPILQVPTPPLPSPPFTPSNIKPKKIGYF
jgi:hypothetical protein